MGITIASLFNIALSGGFTIVFLFCYLGVMGLEFVNGFHDTANAVATVIYTKTLKPYMAIVWSGMWNFLGVLVVGTAVAITLLKLVPLDSLVTLPLQLGACLIIAILLASIVWNLGTWFLGIPLSSTHTLIGALIGASLAFTYFYGGPGVNWGKAGEIGLSLLISPVIGFGGAALLILLERRVIKSERFFHVPKGDDDKPPMPIRILLVCTCMLVSFFHGSNDGQKGVGLLMLVLIVFLPATFAFNPNISTEQCNKWLDNTELVVHQLHESDAAKKLVKTIQETKQQTGYRESGKTSDKFKLRKSVQKVVAELKALKDSEEKAIDPEVKKELETDIDNLQHVTDFAPIWVIFTISLSLALGTMIGWKRIVVTIGEKIGKEHLNYAQGSTAEIIAAATIGLSTGFGLPVSTTHVLSSAVAGAMRASKGDGNLNYKTIKSIALAWLLTLPVAIALAFLLFTIFHLGL